MEKKDYLQVGTCIVDEDGKIVELKRQYHGQGWIFKDAKAYYEDKTKPCYVPELSDTVYTGEDFQRMCNNQPEIADYVFDVVDWQHPESYLDEQDEEELTECECGKWYWSYGVRNCPHCGRKNPYYNDITEWQSEENIAYV